jgi:hypothetical protein
MQDDTCGCGRSGGYYKSDGIKAVIYGRAVPLGFDNTSLGRALMDRKRVSGMSMAFDAYVISEPCKEITRLK